MAFDLSQLAPERKLPVRKPAWLLWFVLFVVVVGGTGFAVMVLWPQGRATGALWFWSCAVGLPAAGWLAGFLYYLGSLRAPRLAAEQFNEVRQDYIAGIRREAGKPLAVLDSGFVFSEKHQENNLAAVTGRKLKLVRGNRYISDDATFVARWLQPDTGVWQPVAGQPVDVVRQQHVLDWLLQALLAQVLPTLHALPKYLPLRVQFYLSSLLPESAVERSWHRHWQASDLPLPLAFECLSRPPELIEVDGWLDDPIRFDDTAVTVLCLVKLHKMLNSSPPAESAEVGAILLLAPAALLTKNALTAGAWLHRPEKCDVAGADQGLRQALLWADATAPEVLDQWLTGAPDATLRKSLDSCLEAQSVGVADAPEPAGKHELDEQIGHSDAIGPWLSTALAAGHAAATGRRQLLSHAQAQQWTLAIVAPSV